ncbi:glycosyltransferase family 2 protein [Methanobrevibacter sp.]|uniref:glycosyltransferase family 2 protein n=1 Tax=Methanobrevibacter sp. TaxID=66852 RepID=UPI0025DC99EE|nr:glycosyltransferase family 2 protein [Methanobrevibacter sp.]MBQ6511873.1 glycosyltransferase family 2 protein [Methanobrevibacter sp.]
MNYKISVIIPCYNAESTLKRCIDSVINQTFGFENIELILYDDASTDSTKKIIENYAKQYENIVPIYSSENSGFPVRGRNKGIEIASSDYIMFMDNDDEYDLNVCEFFYNIINESNPDLISCGKVNLDNITTKYTPTSPNGKEKINIAKEDIIYFEDRFIWNKIYKRSILIENNILFPEGKYAEDLYFTILYLLHCNSLIDVPEYNGYIRHVQEDSISRTWDLNDLTMIIGVDKLIYSKISNNKNIDFSRLYKKEISILIYKLYGLHLLKEKQGVITYLNHLYDFENDISFKGSLDTSIQDIANKLLLKERFNLCYYYLKIVEKIYDSHILRKLYRKTNNL